VKLDYHIFKRSVYRLPPPGSLVTNPSVVESMMKRSTPAPLPAPFLQPGGSGQMPGATTIKDFKDLTKILVQALLKAEPRPAAPRVVPDSTPVTAKSVDGFGFVPDQPKVAGGYSEAGVDPTHTPTIEQVLDWS
jgi:hypothetical protein